MSASSVAADVEEMEVDVDIAEACSHLTSQCSADLPEMGVDGEVVEAASRLGNRTMWLPAGPASIQEIWNWAPRMVAEVEASSYGRHLMASLVPAMQGGIALCTDFSGMGAPEMAASCIVKALSGWMVEADSLQCWRACDTMPLARKVLCVQHPHNPRHVFGDVYERVAPEAQVCKGIALFTSQSDF